MKALLLALGMLVAATGCGASAQSTDSPRRAAFAHARDGAKQQALASLSSDHRAKVDAIVQGTQNGKFSDVKSAAQAIDATLSPQEAQSVLAARDDMMQKIRAARQASGDQNGAPRPRRNGGTQMNDPGYFLLSLELNRAQLRSLAQHGPQ